MQKHTGLDVMTKSIRPITIRNTTLCHEHTIMSVKAKNCHGKNAPIMDAKGILNPKYAIIGFCNQQTKNAKQKITIYAEIMNA